MPRLSEDQTTRIVSLLHQGQSSRQIRSQTGAHLSTIGRIRSEHCPDLPKSSGGRPPILTPTSKRYAACLITTGQASTATQATRLLQDTINIPVSSQTVRRGLQDEGLTAVTKIKRPLLAPRHIKARLDFALAHKDWTLEDWKKVVWSDETKINRLGSDGEHYVWRRKGEKLSKRLVQGTVKFGGGSLMMWGCMGWDGPGYASMIEGRMDAETYVELMEGPLMETLEYWGKEPGEIIFQQDNDPKHTSKQAKSWFNDHDFEVMKWPAQSPDLNPIEHLWYHLKRKLAEYKDEPKGMLELWDRVEEQWNKIEAGVCQNLIESMPSRIEAVLEAKGGYTKY